MNPHMWLNPATRRNVVQLQLDGVRFVGPAHGEMAERGETGPGRLVEVPDLIVAIENAMAPSRGEQSPSQAATSSSPAVRRTNRSIRCATLQTAHRGSRAKNSLPPQPA